MAPPSSLAIARLVKVKKSFMVLMKQGFGWLRLERIRVGSGSILILVQTSLCSFNDDHEISIRITLVACVSLAEYHLIALRLRSTVYTGRGNHQCCYKESLQNTNNRCTLSAESKGCAKHQALRPSMALNLLIDASQMPSGMGAWFQYPQL